MKFKIICDQPGRLRARFGKYIFTKEQCFGLSELLLSLDGVTFANVNYVNGSVLINYDENKDGILAFLSKLSLNDIKDDIVPTTIQDQILTSEFKKKLFFHCAKHLAKTWFLPTKFRNVITCFRGIPYFKAGLHALHSGKFGVEVLDATAIGTSMCCKHFTTASSTMFLLGLSDLLLEYSNRRAKNALASSLAINIDKVWLVKDDLEVEISMNDLQVADVIRIRQGSMIPIDGTIVSGDALINEATMTGEPLSVHKTIDATVFAGTILEDGEIDVRVLNLKNDSRIAKIIDMIDTGEKEKANIQGKAERLSDDIVPVSFGLFAATLLLTRNFSRALSVLMVDFSCAIKLTTPITIISALKEGVNHEILVKGGKYLEILSNVDTVVFDKTGTLTNAVPKVSKVIVMKEGYTQDKVLLIAACLEEHFPHSVAASIVAHSKEKNLVHPENHGKVEYIVAHGIASSYNGYRSIIGSKHFVFEDEGVPFPTDKEDFLNSEIGSDSAVYLALDNELIGIICVNDPPRIDAKQTIDALRQQGISEIIMITGDSEGSAKYVSNALNLDGYYAAVLPDGKAHIIEELRKSGKTVLMVGDGINDTPALSCADVSLTLNGSSDIAREVADISILSDNLSKIVTARRLSTGLMKKIHNHYSFIVAFNSSLIALGLFGVIAANTSAWLHNTSTISLAGISTRPILNEKETTEEDNSNEET